MNLTELRQHLFKLADQVAVTGVPLLIERRGVRLKLVRDDAPAMPSRLQKLKAQVLVNGAPLAPEESPAAWSELPLGTVAEPRAVSAPAASKSRKRRPAP